MPKFANYLYDGKKWLTQAQVRAMRTWKRIQDAPLSVTIIRNSTALPAQTVRVDVFAGGGYGGEVTDTLIQGILVLGVKDHPTVPDTDLKPGDRFIYDKAEYEIQTVDKFPGSIQGQGQRRK